MATLLTTEPVVLPKTKLEFYIPFKSQGHIGKDPSIGTYASQNHTEVTVVRCQTG